ncbi:GNAT family N-acetyltransferase [Pseudalkalibacillus hwajinpoensis]|uniref:GNAT family N-acetyltransferase n=1 Tax=Guptibacillus hwajinpoensis TaxID=208199 RepID=A0A4U1MPD7_9BACL|nr:GNAT family N-acetyltransferase [Pseudalkalibacillus hwajinpoensis]
MIIGSIISAQDQYIVRVATEADAKNLSELRVQIDGETENLDREQGESNINESEFIRIIRDDHERERNLFLVAEVDNSIVAYSRCEGTTLKRLSHKVQFGVGVLKEYWGYGIGTSLLKQSLHWADTSGIKKVTLSVLETNKKAIQLYHNHGFEVEGILKHDKLLSDGIYYNTVVMGRLMG